MSSIFCHSRTPVPSQIRLLEVYPITSCAGTTYELNEDIVLAIRKDGDHFKWHEVNVSPDSMAFTANEENLKRAAQVCGLESPYEPAGHNSASQPSCPVRNPAEPCKSSGVFNSVSLGTFIAVLLSSLVTYE